MCRAGDLDGIPAHLKVVESSGGNHILSYGSAILRMSASGTSPAWPAMKTSFCQLRRYRSFLRGTAPNHLSIIAPGCRTRYREDLSFGSSAVLHKEYTL